MTTVINTVAQTPSPGERVELFQLDTTSVGGPLYYFCQSKFEAASVIFGGVTYTAVDVEFRDMQVSGLGALPTPTISISNSNSIYQAIVNTYGDLLGCTLSRIRTFKRFLDGQPDADPTAYFGPDIFYVEQKTNETPIAIEWKLSASIDQDGKMLPGRQVIRDTCLWRYRVWTGAVFDYTKAQCPYAGATSYDVNGTVTTSANDRCARTIDACQLRFGAGQPIPFGGFPGVGRVR